MVVKYGHALAGINKQTSKDIFSFLMSHKHNFEKLQGKLCKNILGVSKYTPDTTAKAEMGVYPIMAIILKHIFSYWQHVIHSSSNSLLHETLLTTMQMDRNDITSYYTRIKNLLTILDLRSGIYLVHNKEVNKYSEKFKIKYKELFVLHYFKNLKPTGKTTIYHDIKKNYKFEPYLLFIKDKNLRNNITRIRTSSHPLPVEYYRRKGLQRAQRICNLCVTDSVGDEMHILNLCDNSTVQTLRNDLHYKLITLNPQWQKFNFKNMFQLLLLANEYLPSFYFAIFLSKLFKLVKSKYKL